ncbi:DUF1236 domain-containing protein [Bradyrhizobium genosp. P]|uniref:DUF1236 domain-containing protein n=1 Tax=Bradyrhizobium genosp. P TaxID=83641 RepID=UPI003CEF7B50
MKTTLSLAIAAVLALSGASAAAASQMSSHAGKMSGASDTLTLSDTQQKSIWKDVNHHAANQTAPSGFTAAVGTAVPSTVNTYPLPLQARRDVPAARPYRYAMMQDKVLLVNPSDHKIAGVVAK